MTDHFNRRIMEQAAALLNRYANQPESVDDPDHDDDDRPRGRDMLFVPSPKAMAIVKFCEALMINATGCPLLEHALGMQVMSQPQVETIDTSWLGGQEHAVVRPVPLLVSVELTYCLTPDLLHGLMQESINGNRNFYYAGGVMADFTPNQLVTVTLGTILSEPQRRDLVGLMAMES